MEAKVPIHIRNVALVRSIMATKAKALPKVTSTPMVMEVLVHPAITTMVTAARLPEVAALQVPHHLYCNARW